MLPGVQGEEPRQTQRLGPDHHLREQGDTLVVITADHETGGMSLGRDQIYRWDARPLRGVRHSTQWMMQEYLDGDEYNLDVLRDAHGQVVAVSVKQKLEMIGGSTDRAVSIRSPELCRLGARLADELCALGSIDVDVIGSRGRAFVIDINPRLGGGFPFTATYGPRYVDLLLEVCLGRSVGPFFPDYEHGLLVCREHTYSTSSTQREAGDPRFAAPEIAEENE